MCAPAAGKAPFTACASAEEDKSQLETQSHREQSL